MKIGIPRALLYYIYFPFWKIFFEGLGHTVLVSARTNNRVLDKGVKHCVDDACLPVKLFHGHVMDLIGRADRILIPRLISVEPGEYICPKFIGLPEMIKHSVPGVTPLMVMDYNAHKHANRAYDGCRTIARELGASEALTERALRQAAAVQKQYEGQLRLGKNPVHLLEKKSGRPSNQEEKGTIALIGHPYLLYDAHISMDIVQKLSARRYRALFPENIEPEAIERACRRLPKKLFWSYGKKLLGGGLHLLEQGSIQGMIFLTSFGCGIDSFITELLQRINQREAQLPYCTITLDEHSGHAGFDTRLEAFIDMMEWRRDNGHYLSPHGADVHAGQSHL